MALAPECSSCCFSVYFDVLDAKLKRFRSPVWKWWCCVRGLCGAWQWAQLSQEHRSITNKQQVSHAPSVSEELHLIVQHSPPRKSQFLCWPWKALERGCSWKHTRGARTFPVLPQRWDGVDGSAASFRKLAASKHSWCIPMEIQLSLYSLFPEVCGLETS